MKVLIYQLELCMRHTQCFRNAASNETILSSVQFHKSDSRCWFFFLANVISYLVTKTTKNNVTIIKCKFCKATLSHKKRVSTCVMPWQTMAWRVNKFSYTCTHVGNILSLQLLFAMPYLLPSTSLSLSLSRYMYRSTIRQVVTSYNE